MWWHVGLTIRLSLLHTTDRTSWLLASPRAVDLVILTGQVWCISILVVRYRVTICITGTPRKS